MSRGHISDSRRPKRENSTASNTLKAGSVLNLREGESTVDSGVDVEKYRKNGTLSLASLTEHFMSNGKLNYKKAVDSSLDRWFETKRKGFKHVRDIEDVGNFSFCGGKWQKYAIEYWLDPRWDEPSVSQWAVSKEPVGVVYKPFILEITSINVRHMTETQITDLLKMLGKGAIIRTRIIESFGRHT